MLNVAAIQMKSKMGDVHHNQQKAVQLIRDAAAEGARLICLPELWITGYHLSPEEFQQLAEPANGVTLRLFQALAKELEVVLIISFPERDEEDLFISCAVIDTDGQICGIYRKTMLWSHEQSIFNRGAYDYTVFPTAVGRIGILICYDIEFPEPARLLTLQNLDMIIVPAVWSFNGEPRWDIQLPARALDNSCFVMGVNTVGNGACGKSKVIDPLGKVLEEASTTEEEIVYTTIHYEELNRAREEIPYLKEYPLELTPGGMSQLRDYIRGA